MKTPLFILPMKQHSLGKCKGDMKASECSLVPHLFCSPPYSQMLAWLVQKWCSTNICGRKTWLRGLQVVETRRKILVLCLRTVIIAFPKLSCFFKAVFISLFLLFLCIFLFLSLDFFVEVQAVADYYVLVYWTCLHVTEGWEKWRK